MFAKKTTMEVQFKVYTFWNENDKPEVRRFGIERSVVSSFQYLNAKLQDIYPKLRGKSFTVSWKDEEGDDVTISSDDEIMIALTSMSDDLKKIYVYCKDTTEQSNIDCDIVITGEHSFETGTNIPHGGVVCDGCDAPVTGFRYKCTSCDDYDLCSKCEAAGMHPEHCMVRVPAPTLPRTVIKSAVKRSRHFLKTLNAMNEEHCKRQCNDSGRRRDHSHGHGHHRRQSRDDHNRRSRTSWLETFSTYMNEFANLAGDVVIETGEEGPKPQGNAAPKQTETPKPQTTGAQASASKQSTSAKAQSKQNPKAATSHCEFSGDLNMEKVQKLLNMFLGDNMNAFKPQPSTSNADEEMGQGDRKTSETDKDSIKSEVTSTSNAAERKKDDSPDKTDGWTVINTDKDLTESEAKGSDPARPIGFNLPEEFQERVRISEGQNIYPPLNVATAVLNTKEPEFKEQAAKPSAPEEAKDEAAAKPKAAKPSAKPVDPEHPMAHIQAAIEQMITMGFTNDGGWLTQLLENKDGNIAAVLDLLTPTNPKK